METYIFNPTSTDFLDVPYKNDERYTIKAGETITCSQEVAKYLTRLTDKVLKEVAKPVVYYSEDYQKKSVEPKSKVQSGRKRVYPFVYVALKKVGLSLVEAKEKEAGELSQLGLSEKVIQSILAS